MASRRPRNARNASSSSASIGSPVEGNDSAVTRALSGSRRSSDKPVTVLPDPDSPITPSTSPRRMVEIDAADRLDRRRLPMRKRADRFLISTSGLDAGVCAHELVFSRSLGSVRSRMPSPSRLRPSKPKEMNRPGERQHPGAAIESTRARRP